MITKRTLNKAIKIAGNQSRLAEYLGVTRQMVSEVKRGLCPFPKAKVGMIEELINSSSPRVSP